LLAVTLTVISIKTWEIGLVPPGGVPNMMLAGGEIVPAEFQGWYSMNES
jgi:hypothetical protein